MVLGRIVAGLLFIALCLLCHMTYAAPTITLTVDAARSGPIIALVFDAPELDQTFTRGFPVEVPGMPGSIDRQTETVRWLTICQLDVEAEIRSLLDNPDLIFEYNYTDQARAILYIYIC